jgi:uncharacterized protein (DUF305 family)
MRFRLLLLLVAVLLVSSASGGLAQQTGRDPAPDPKVADLESSFLMGMIPHHRNAIAMAQMALTKSSRPELRTLAQSIIDSQQAEVEQMTGYLRDWYGMDPPSGSTIPPEVMSKFDEPVLQGLEPDMSAQMMALDAKSGADFDVAFMKAMIQHHSMAIMMAAPVLTAGYHQDLVTLSENIVISQGNEIRQMDQWLDAWYGVKRPY